MTIINPDVDYNSKTLQQKLTELAPAYDPLKHVAVTKIFKTIQGEMPFAGMPAIFLRLAGCNRGEKLNSGCYFCDTLFAVNNTTKLYSIAALYQELALIAKDMASTLLVISGGEPMLQAPVLKEFLEYVLEQEDPVFTMIQFETNGDLFKTLPARELLEFIDEVNEEIREAEDDDGDDSPHEFINLVISPKRTIKEPKTGAFIDKAEVPGYYLRLVIDGDPDSVYHTIPEFLLDGWPNEEFYISPLTVYKRTPNDAEITNIVDDIDLDATRRNVARTLELSYMFGMRVSLQAHSYIGIA